jgi:hypothetical protein
MRKTALDVSEKFATNTEPETFADRQALRDVLLVALTVASGAVDAISYFGLGKIFSAFMTGNIVFLGFGIAEIEGPDVVPVIFAISMFARGPISVYGSRRNTPANLVRGPGNDGIARPHRDRRGCFPSRVVGSRRTSPDEGLRRAHRLVLAGHGRSRPQPFDHSVCKAFSPQLGRSRWSHSPVRSLLHARSYAPVLPFAITVLAIVAGRGLARRTSAEVDSHRLSTVGNRVLDAAVHARSVESEDAQP